MLRLCELRGESLDIALRETSDGEVDGTRAPPRCAISDLLFCHSMLQIGPMWNANFVTSSLVHFRRADRLKTKINKKKSKSSEFLTREISQVY